MKSPLCALSLFLLILISTSMAHSMMVGAFGEAKEPTEDIVDMVGKLRPQIEAAVCVKEGVCSDRGQFRVIAYESQVVAGTNYIVEIGMGNMRFAVKIYQPLPYTGKPAELTKVVEMHPGQELGFELFEREEMQRQKEPRRVDLY